MNPHQRAKLLVAFDQASHLTRLAEALDTTGHASALRVVQMVGAGLRWDGGRRGDGGQVVQRRDSSTPGSGAALQLYLEAVRPVHAHKVEGLNMGTSQTVFEGLVRAVFTSRRSPPPPG
jgi:hypothetical protein